ncbi:MAG: hypothetical protein ACRD72_07665 [Candidatus Angelobacter sp.]|jgi:hypothetical protein
MKTLFETAFRDGSPEGAFLLPLILRVAILVMRYLISLALRAGWRRIKFSNVGDLARQILPKPLLPPLAIHRALAALHDIPVLWSNRDIAAKQNKLNKKVGVETGREYLSLPPKTSDCSLWNQPGA